MKAGVKKILAISVWTLFTVGLFVLMSFAQHRHEKHLCTRLDISIERKADHFFIAEDDIRELLKERGRPVEGQPMAGIDINYLEKLISAHPAVETVDVFAGVGGVVKMKIVQRRPLVRIINSREESFYIDDKGKIMPWAENYTAPVLLVNGDINDGYGSMYKYSVAQIEKDTMLEMHSLIDDVFRLASIIDADTFLRAQVVQAYYVTGKGFELTPRVGSHKIILGKPVGMAEKLGKLKLFYKEGLNTTGNWNVYSVINLEYKNQVVCTKRPLIQ
ncbi:MAG: hypothetical protein FD123_1609 [Bacteroidetes bacterium]|nr:MAG: hypothetical protein FD123_1609 [Bacteroidota bacterium]